MQPHEAACSPGRLGVRHCLLVFAAPRKLFERVEDTGAYGWTLATLLGLTALLGYVSVQTGLIGRAIDEQTERSLATIEQDQAHLVDRVELRENMADVRKQAQFTKLLAHLQAVAFTPLWRLATYLLIASMLYAVVALLGGKPEYHSLTTVCVYAGFIDLAAQMLQLAMMMRYRTIYVDTSLGMLAAPGEPTLLAAFDPFRIWFWVLVAMGLIVTGQLSRRAAIASCFLMALTAAGVRTALPFLMMKA